MATNNFLKINEGFILKLKEKFHFFKNKQYFYNP